MTDKLCEQSLSVLKNANARADADVAQGLQAKMLSQLSCKISGRSYAMKLQENIILKRFKGVSEFYGNGTVFVTHDGHVQKFETHNFSISPVRLDEDKGDYWILDDLAVTLGAGCSPERAIPQLESVIRELKREI